MKHMEYVIIYIYGSICRRAHTANDKWAFFPYRKFFKKKSNRINKQKRSAACCYGETNNLFFRRASQRRRTNYNKFKSRPKCALNKFRILVLIYNYHLTKKKVLWNLSRYTFVPATHKINVLCLWWT